MKRLTFLALTLFSTYLVANAQSDKKPEFFAGYSYESAESGVTSSDLQTSGPDRTLNGVRISAGIVIK